ncbi:major facilitator superfamily domain-containing protein [Mycena galopus ATCC 62051]|nr:major facilitator superfamily domain-containing protein [Mycena galopus ATCC 62051]
MSTHKATTEDAVDPSPEELVQTQRAATTRFYGKAKWPLFISSEFGNLHLLGPIQVAQGIIIAVGKPVIAKIADVGSRGTAYCGVLIFYVIGYTVIATAQSIQAVTAGICLYAIGLQLLTQVVIADITTLKWRGLVLSLNSVPYLINAFVGSNISAAIIQHVGWRWGYGMFIILIPIALAPLIATLLWSERITKRRRSTHAVEPKKPYTERLSDTAEELDAVGLFLIGTSISLTLLPLSLVRHTENWRDSAGVLGIFLLGLVFIPVFALWDFRWAKYPVIPFRFVVNRSVVGASLIGALDFVRGWYGVLPPLIASIHNINFRKLINTTYFMQIQSISMTLCGILTGLYMHRFRRYKMLLVAGLIVRLLGVMLMLRSRGTEGSNFELAMTQILQGIGGGIAALSIQVSSQASVIPGDVAMVTAVVLLITEFGAAGGGAIAGAIWSSEMPSKLREHLPFLSQAERDKLFGSITEAASKPRGDPVREGVISAYSDVMKTMVYVGIAVSILPILIAMFMPDWYLGDEQSAKAVSEVLEVDEDLDDD